LLQSNSSTLEFLSVVAIVPEHDVNINVLAPSIVMVQ
jgi:hypothetical protein